MTRRSRSRPMKLGAQAGGAAVEVLEGPARRPRAAQLFGLSADRGDAAAECRPLVLIAATTRGGAGVRQALAFFEAGFLVEAACPGGHALRRLGWVRALHPLDAVDPLASLRRAIEACSPDLVVPGDDRVAAYLRDLYAAVSAREDAAAIALRALIARSVGEPAHFGDAASRVRVLELAGEEGVRRADAVVVCGLDDLRRGLREFGCPAVLGTDDGASGEGVVVRDLGQARRAYRRLAGRPALTAAFRRLAAAKDLDWAAVAAQGRRPLVTLQRHVEGRPANAAAACWRGEVLSLLCVETVRMSPRSGRADVVRTIDRPDMVEAVQRMARRLGLSGLCGFDFRIDRRGAAWLCGVDAGATPISHLCSGEGVDPASALGAYLGGPIGLRRTPRPPGELIALSPEALARNPAGELLLFAWPDLPRAKPDLVELGSKIVDGARLCRRALRRFQGRA